MMNDVPVNQTFDFKASSEKRNCHQNTVGHRTRPIDVYPRRKEDKLACQVRHLEFTAHGEAQNAPPFTHPGTAAAMAASGLGTLIALSLCNIRGWGES